MLHEAFKGTGSFAHAGVFIFNFNILKNNILNNKYSYLNGIVKNEF